MDDEIKLVHALNHGDRKALSQLFAKYAQPLYAYTLAIARNSAGAEDILQEMFMQFLQQGIHASGNVKAYLFQSARNRALNYRASLSRRRELLEKHARDFTLRETNPRTGKREPSELTDLIQSLPEEQREIIVLRFYCDSNFEEIAEMLHTPLSTIYGRYQNALSALRARLGD